MLNDFKVFLKDAIDLFRAVFLVLSILEVIKHGFVRDEKKNLKRKKNKYFSAESSSRNLGRSLFLN
jgi:hypothetical protein